MKEKPLERLIPGGQVSASEYNRLLTLVERLSRLNSVGNGLSDDSTGPTFRESDPPHIWVKITDNPDDYGRYSGIEQLPTRIDKRLVWVDKPGGLTFSPCTYSLYEANDNLDVPADGTIVVEAYRGVGDFWEFPYCCSGSGSGSGNCSGN